MGEEPERWKLREGMSVLGADGGKIGQVVGVQETFFVVEKGWLFPTDYYIPADAIQRVEADVVHLTIPKEEALHHGWDVLPVDEAEALHRDAAAAGTTLGGYTAAMGKMEAEVDIKPTDVAAALEHPAPTPEVPIVPAPPEEPVAAPEQAAERESAEPEPEPVETASAVEKPAVVPSAEAPEVGAAPETKASPAEVADDAQASQASSAGEAVTESPAQPIEPAVAKIVSPEVAAASEPVKSDEAAPSTSPLQVKQDDASKKSPERADKPRDEG